MADNWSDHWTRLGALQERVEQHATGRRCTPIDARADFAGFIVESENLRDAAKHALGSRAKEVDPAMCNSTSLQLAHDLAIKLKHVTQDRGRPWSTAEDANYIVKVSKGIRDHASPVARRGGSTTLPGTPPLPPTEPRSWVHQWEIRYTPRSTMLTVDGIQFSRAVTADWQQVLVGLGLLQ